MTSASPTIGIGALRDRLVLEQPVRGGDGGGGASIVWTEVANLWASVQPITGEERLGADAVSGRVTHKVVIRHRAGVVPAMRFRQAARVLEITAVLDAGRRGPLVCLCEERNL